MVKKIKFSVLIAISAILFASWAESKQQIIQAQYSISDTNCDADSSKVFGFGFLNRIVGQWNGPVFSSTPAGSFENWHVDFRPVSEAQVSQYTSFDTSAINYTSFFIVKHNNQLKVAMRTEGVFNNKGCVTYEVADSVNESTGYYRFSDFQSGTKRAYTEFTFKNEELVMNVYTNKFNKVNPLQLHSKWTAKLGSKKAALEAIAHFNFPQAIVVKDFSDVFKNTNESIYYSFENDPYPSAPQPYVGSVTVNIAIDENLKTKPTNEVFLLLTTEPLFDGIKYLNENLKYKSKYITLPLGVKSFTLSNVHPGTYYLYSFIDTNADKKHLSGDFMCSDVTNIFTVKPSSNTIVHTGIDFVIP